MKHCLWATGISLCILGAYVWWDTWVHAMGGIDRILQEYRLKRRLNGHKPLREQPDYSLWATRDAGETDTDACG